MAEVTGGAPQGRSGVRGGRAAARRLAMALAVWAAGAGVSRGALVLTSSSASTTYSVRSLNPVPNETGTSAVSATGQLLSVRSFFNSPTSGGEPTNLGATQTFNTGSLATSFSTRANGDLINNGNGFGTASTNLSTIVSGTIASGAANRVGVNWFSTAATSVGEFNELATVSVTRASATFTNNSSTAVTGTPGASIAMSGTLANFGYSFVAASLVSTITTTIGNVVTVINLPPIIFAYGFFEGEQRFEVADGPTYASLKGNDLSYSFNGVSRAGGVTFGLNDRFTVSSTLTLIADPSEIGVTEMTDPQAIGLLPDFGTFVQDSPASAVPEPVTLASAALGVAAAAVLSWRRGRARA